MMRIFLIFTLIAVAAVTYWFIPTIDRVAQLAQRNTQRFSQNSYAPQHIRAVSDYMKDSKIDSAYFIYKFNGGTWKADPIIESRRDSFPHNRFSNELREWLNTHCKNGIKEGLTFIYMPQEPLHECGHVPLEQQQKLAELFEHCPILITCTHPKIVWTPKGILIPDPYIMHPNYAKRSVDIPKANLKPFHDRKSQIFFRGALTGNDSYVYTMKAVEQDERVLLFLKSKRDTFVDARITAVSPMKPGDRMHADFVEWFKANLDDRRGDTVDFQTHARYKYLISIDGYGAAWSRVPYILFTGSILLLRADCKQYFYDLMENNKTHIEVAPRLENLDNIFYTLEKNPYVAEEIGKNGQAFAKKYMSEDRINDYLKMVVMELNHAFRPDES